MEYIFVLHGYIRLINIFWGKAFQILMSLLKQN